MQRADRARAQAEKQQKKLDRRAERAAQRKARDAELEPSAPPREDQEPET